jgi:NAD(P)-dependent dehydrogenase (short-subunit alcohol dehydrogenase family)
MSNKSIFITGASRGLGNEIKNNLEQKGYKIVAPSRSALDLSSKGSILKYLESNQNDEFYALIFNAGINYPSQLEKQTPEEYENIIEVNLMSIIRLLNHFLKSNSNLKHIIFISSIWSLKGKSGRSVYAASKAGIDALARNLAVELSDKQILVNSLIIGYMNTEMTYQNNSIDIIRTIVNSIPTKRLIETKEVSELIFYLLEKNLSINGQSIIIDGGYTIK